MKSRRARLLALVSTALVVIPVALGAYRIFGLGYDLSDVLPREQYRVGIHMRLDGGLERVKVRTFIPQDDTRQQISEEQQDSGAEFRFSAENSGLNRRAVWVGNGVADDSEIDFHFSVLSSAVHYDIDPTLVVPDGYPAGLQEFLRPEPEVQVDSDEVRHALVRVGGDVGSLKERLTHIFQLTAGLTPKHFKGTTDALTALRLGEASCNGKSRLFVAMARAANIPTRLVGGVIADGTDKRTSHQWVEASIGGHWVPFDPTNRHFAELPANYIVFYRGDEVLFSHTADTNFDYTFSTSTKLVPSPEARAAFHAFNVWDLFARLKLPFSLLRTVLMLPIGALIVVFFRNVIGVPTFGTFLPALIAAAIAETGLFWGIVSISLVVAVVACARLAINQLGLLHSPTLAILLAVVVITMLGVSLGAEKLHLYELARISYFPIAVMAIASERFYLALVEQSAKDAVRQFGGTMVVVLGCFVVMNSLAMQVLISGFPEILLLVIAANVYLGRWVGVRLLELGRFRDLLRGAT